MRAAVLEQGCPEPYAEQAERFALDRLTLDGNSLLAGELSLFQAALDVLAALFRTGER